MGQKRGSYKPRTKASKKRSDAGKTRKPYMTKKRKELAAQALANNNSISDALTSQSRSLS